MNSKRISTSRWRVFSPRQVDKNRFIKWNRPVRSGFRSLNKLQILLITGVRASAYCRDLKLSFRAKIF